jgi:hypothetical protein
MGQFGPHLVHNGFVKVRYLCPTLASAPLSHRPTRLRLVGDSGSGTCVPGWRWFSTSLAAVSQRFQMSRRFPGRRGASRIPNHLFVVAWHPRAVRSLEAGECKTQGGRKAERVSSFLRKVVSVFGREIFKSVKFSNGWLDDWEYVYYDLVFEQLSNSYRLRVDITKDSGDRVRIEGPPDSLMVFVTQMTEMLHTVGSQEFFTEETRQTFLQRMDDLSAMLRPKAGGSQDSG